MPAEHRAASEDRGRVVWLRPNAGTGTGPVPRVLAQGRGPVEGLARYARTGEPDDYRHRMINNALALVVLAFLVVAGLWLADRIADLRQTQDCVLSGRRVCAPITAVSPGRY